MRTFLTFLRRLTLALSALALALVCVIVAATVRSDDMTVVHYEGAVVRVPVQWPVVHLAAHGTTCVRFDRHALYLGTPSPNEACPATAMGRTEAILLEPRGTATAATLPATGVAGARAAVLPLGRRVQAVVTWASDRSLITRALGVRTLPTAPIPASTVSAAATTSAPLPPILVSGRASAALAAVLRSSRRRGPALAHDVAMAGGTGSLHGPAFDACSAPSAARMDAWLSSPYRGIGVYIGGVNSACAQPNLTPAWVSHVSATGWHLLLTYVGLQAPSNTCDCVGISAGAEAAQGTQAADDAAARATALGIGSGRPIYFDMEGYSRTARNTTAVLGFLAAWTAELHRDGFRSGVYSSVESGIADLLAMAGTSYAEPDDLWYADWDGSATTKPSYLPAGDWSAHRTHQYAGDHVERFGGVSMHIDSDVVDGDTTGPSTGAPTASPAASPAPVAGPPLVVVPPVASSGTGVAPAVSAVPSVPAAPTPTPTTPAIPAIAAAADRAPRHRTGGLARRARGGRGPHRAPEPLGPPGAPGAVVRRSSTSRPVVRPGAHAHHPVHPAPPARPLAPPHPSAPPVPQPVAPAAPAVLHDGDLVEVAGSGALYRIAGGAPLFVESPSDIGASQPAITISADQFAGLPPVPADGSVLSTESGGGYIVAGGYPFALPSGAVPGSAVLVDGWDLVHLGSALAHLNGTPADGTVVQGEPSGTVWVFHGGRRTPAEASGAAIVVSDAALTAWPSTRS